MKIPSACLVIAVLISIQGEGQTDKPLSQRFDAVVRTAVTGEHIKRVVIRSGTYDEEVQWTSENGEIKVDYFIQPSVDAAAKRLESDFHGISVGKRRIQGVADEAFEVQPLLGRYILRFRHGPVVVELRSVGTNGTELAELLTQAIDRSIAAGELRRR